MRWSSSRRWACAPRLGRRLGRTASIFIDLVDFTRASTGLDAAEFGRVLGRFKALAWDEITEAGGRLVKLVGDEAMFVAPADGRAADAALAILSQCGRESCRAPVAASRRASFSPAVATTSVRW